MEYALFWIANGFDPEDSTRTDDFSRNCLAEAVSRYRELKEEGEVVHFPIINSKVRDTSGRHILRDVLWAEAERAGVNRKDMSFTIGTTGSPTDGLAITKFSQAHPDVQIEIYATCRETAAFFTVMYWYVARWIEDYELDFAIHFPSNVYPNLRSRFRYLAMRLVTRVAARNYFLFKAWYGFLNRIYARRVRGFVRTVE